MSSHVKQPELTHRTCVVDDVVVVTNATPDDNAIDMIIDLVDDDKNERVTVQFEDDLDFVDFLNRLQVSFLHATHSCTNHS
ncbi:hypothetical protein LCGC14_1800860 [marine sediment metagenome]|uniref:Uncharacterized protein n=1 Tax=marine sediment metagenome TaxID=412755 RepID=A0A0F9GPV3_9ZZZZ